MNRKVIIAICVVVALLVGCGAVACTPVGNAIGVTSYDSDHRSKKKKCVARNSKGKCTKYRTTNR